METDQRMTNTAHGAVFSTLWVQLPGSSPPLNDMDSIIELTFKLLFFIVTHTED